MKRINLFNLCKWTLLFIGVTANAQWNNSLQTEILSKLREPVFKKDTFDIRQYGALNDGITLNTNSFAQAIDACNKNGGGVVLVPEGLWYTGPIELKSNVNLHLKKGALVLFSRKFDDYPMVLSYYEGESTWRCQSPISGRNLENIAITGYGVFDGSGDAWRFVKKSKLTAIQWKDLVASGGVLNDDKNIWYPSEKSKMGNIKYNDQKLPPVSDKASYEAIKDYLRPVMLSLIECKQVLLDGTTFQNSPSWCLHPLLCEHLTVRNINVRNPWYAQNGDGIDVESCSYGTIQNSTFDVGDDAICIKSGRDAEGRKRGKPTENFVITNNIVYHGHGGFVIGSEMSGGVRNMFVQNCTFLGTDIGLRFKTTRGRGGVVENIYISDISMINIPAEAILFDMFYNKTSPLPEGDEKPILETNRKDVEFSVNEGTPQFKDFYIRNIQCNGAAKAIHIGGLPEMNIKNINIENASIKATSGISLIQCDKLNLKNIKLEIEKGPGVFISETKNIKLEELKVLGNTGKLIEIEGANTKNIDISNSKCSFNGTNLLIKENVNKKEIIK
jgi:DNA sulfur modification protein DndE